ncbi:MAG: TetR/AcrR family transcriptional regulator [Haliangium ochraceum]
MTIRVTRKPRDAYQHGNLREALIQAGLRLLAEGGVENLSLRAAAQLAGVSHAAPYRHFRDKEALVAAVAERGFTLLDSAMREELARCASSDTRDRVVALGVGYLAFATRHPAYLQVIFSGALSRRHVPAELTAAGDAAYRTLRDTVAAGIARGELRAGDPERVSLACWSLVHGLATLLINSAIPSPSTPAAQRELVIGIVRLLNEGIGRGTPPGLSPPAVAGALP